MKKIIKASEYNNTATGNQRFLSESGAPYRSGFVVVFKDGSSSYAKTKKEAEKLQQPTRLNDGANISHDEICFNDAVERGLWSEETHQLSLKK